MSVSVQAQAAELLALLSDSARLRVLAHLAEVGNVGMTLTELAEVLRLPMTKVGEMCARMVSLGVLSREEGRFRARLVGFREAAGALDTLQPINVLLGEYPNLKAVFSHGRLVSVPPAGGAAHSQLAELLTRFLGLQGPTREAEINKRLGEVSDDPARMRRMLVDTGWLTRDSAGSVYQLGQSESLGLG